MHTYEVRILRPDGRAALITAESHWNDDAAIRSAKKIARGRQFEIWRGMDCIYGRRPLGMQYSPNLLKP